MAIEVKWQYRWERIRQEWQANKRLQAISLLASILLILWVHVQLNDWRIAKKADAKQALIVYQDTQVVARENEWLERAKTSRSTLDVLRTKLWRAASEGEAEAKLRDWLQKIAKETGLPINRISVEIGAAPRGFAWRPVHVDIQGVYQAGAWQLLLEKMNTNIPPVVVDFEQINIENSSNLFYRLNVTAWFAIGDGA